MRDLDTIDSELQLVAALRRAARERGGPLPSMDVADALLDERRELTGLPRLTSCLDKHKGETRGSDLQLCRWAKGCVSSRHRSQLSRDIVYTRRQGLSDGNAAAGGHGRAGRRA
jgi:hypothetical protein